MNLSYLQLIRQNRNFRNLLWGQVISELGNWFNFVAGLGVVRLVSGASPEAAGLLLLFRTLPFAVLMPIAGAVADRFSRRTVLLVSDVLRAGIALLFLLVTRPEDLWIAYGASILLSGATAFFDGAKNAATPNITGKEGLLSGTALMFSTRFLLMAVGAALGGIAAVVFGYEIAFIINAISFLVSAASIWLIPEDAMRQRSPEERVIERQSRPGFFSEIAEGLRYTVKNPFALTILLMNIIWATGGGATNIVFEGLGTMVFTNESTNPDFVYSFLLTANGIGLGLGMLIAHKVGSYVEKLGITRGFMTWTLIIHGVIFGIAGFMPYLWLVALLVMISRAMIGAEYAVQETLFQRSLPDHIRGRISTLDRGAEITMFSISSYAAGISLTVISAESLTMIAGLMAATSGLVWMFRSRGVGHDLKEPEKNANHALEAGN
ncbi:MAG: MFS transporter [Acidobacteria bacterium]|nr:MAG: MFS transporter [Acidobacteriota bacterium]REK02410.1 MAG: MFS transporter [Acidobacteriota bacterium]REK13788.1 MAG: MFS transporter [Acidobacteriota bacterium]REK41782.1 MAG: MFS transporter [Acidobacteriota bacterium]